MSAPFSTLRSTFFVLGAVALVIACAGEAFKAAPETNSTVAAPKSTPPCERTKNQRLLAMINSTIFAQLADGGVAAFDHESGKELARHALSGPVVDLHWEASKNTLVVSEEHATEDASRVLTLKFDGERFCSALESEYWTGPARLWSEGDQLIVFQAAQGYPWLRLDSSLAPLEAGKGMFLPFSVVGLHPGDKKLLALSQAVSDKGEKLDRVIRVSFDAALDQDEIDVAAGDGVAARLAPGSDRDRVWLVQQQSDHSLRLSSLLTQEWKLENKINHFQAPETDGTLQEVAFEEIHDVWVALIARPKGTASLWLLDKHHQQSSSLGLGATAASSTWFSRALILDSSRERVFVATGKGIQAYRWKTHPTGSTLTPDPSFQAPSARQPLVKAKLDSP